MASSLRTEKFAVGSVVVGPPLFQSGKKLKQVGPEHGVGGGGGGGIGGVGSEGVPGFCHQSAFASRVVT